LTKNDHRKVFHWLVLESISVCVGTGQSGTLVKGRDAAYCCRALGIDMKSAVANVTIDAEKNGFPS
jgi:hypothetical protein